MDAEEPRYVRPGDEFGDGDRDRMPKWRKPDGDFQRELFRVTGRKYWPEGSEGKAIRHWFIELERSIVPLGTGIVAEYPEEWVENCLRWAEDKNTRARYPAIGLGAIRSLLMNTDKRDDFIRSWMRKEEHDSGTDSRDKGLGLLA